jgi:hypothetical protein
MSSTAKGKKECGGHIALKLLQFAVSVYLVYALYQVGPYWILLVACLAIPLYGLLLALDLL